MKPLTEEEKRRAFIKATGGDHPAGKERWAEHARAGMTDEELTAALSRALGIFGGSGGPGEISLTFQGSGLKIWASREIVNHIATPPTFAGAATIAMAREVYGITDPTNDQMRLL